MDPVVPASPARAPGWEHSRPRSRTRMLAAALVAVAAVAVGLVAMTREPADVLPVGETETPAPAAFGTLEPMAAAPIAGRAGAAHAWTGQELLVWGGGSLRAGPGPAPRADLLADGAAYEPATDTWRRLPPFPLEPRAGAVAVWTGDRLVVWGGHREDGEVLADGAAYVPAGDRWEVLPPAPDPGRTAAGGTFAGGTVYVAGGMARVPTGSGPVDVAGDGLALDLADGTWRELAMPEEWRPDPWSSFEAAGGRVLLWQRRRGWSYLPAEGRWEPLPSPPAGARTSDGSRLVPLEGGRVLVTGVMPVGGRQALGTVLDVEEGWTATVGAGVTPSPQRLRIDGGEGAVFALSERPEPTSPSPVVALLWDMDLDRLLRIPPEITAERAGYAAAWTGEELLVWGGYHDGATLADGMRWRLSDR